MADSQSSKALRCNIDVSMSHTVFRERHGFSSAIHPRDASVEQDGSLDTYLAKQLSEKDTSRGRSGISFSLATDAGRSHQLLQVLGDRVPSRNWSVLASAYTQSLCFTRGLWYGMLFGPRTYATQSAFESSAGAHYLRPWMLPHRADYGCRGHGDVVHWLLIQTVCAVCSENVHRLFITLMHIYCDPSPTQEVLKALALNMMFRGCVSDPNEPGCEKFVVATINDDKWLRDPRAHISSLEIGAERDLLNPNSVFAVKGWNRSLAALLCLRAACELGDDLIKALLHTMGFRQLHMFCKIHGLGMDRSCRTT